MDTTKLEMEQARAVHAERVLSDPLIAEAFEALERAHIDRWKHETDAEKRERVWLSYQLLGKFKGYFQEMVATGKMAAQTLGDLEARKKRLGLF